MSQPLAHFRCRVCRGSGTVTRTDRPAWEWFGKLWRRLLYLPPKRTRPEEYVVGCPYCGVLNRVRP